VEDFGSNLPAIDLPTVDDLETQPSEIATNQAALGLPDLDAEDTADLTARTTLEQTPATSENAAALIPSGSAVPQPSEVSEPAATPRRNVESEKQQQASEQDIRLRQQRLILSRSGQTGFKGFCPVALRDRRNLVDASPEFTATFGLQTYSFATLEAKAAFEAEPSRYAPAAGGSDVVLLVNSGEEQAGLLDYALWHRDRLYLFRSRETMGQFAENPQRFASQY
jgi:YHS domain-containing protein